MLIRSFSENLSKNLQNLSLFFISGTASPRKIAAPALHLVLSAVLSAVALLAKVEALAKVEGEGGEGESASIRVDKPCPLIRRHRRDPD